MATIVLTRRIAVRAKLAVSSNWFIRGSNARMFTHNHILFGVIWANGTHQQLRPEGGPAMLNIYLGPLVLTVAYAGKHNRFTRRFSFNA